MGKAQNTLAKRPRDATKKGHTEAKGRRAKKNQSAGPARQPDDARCSLSPAELAVLTVFQKYLMSPGKMLCLDTAALKSFDPALSQLIDKELLVAENSRGRYSLTEKGFAAMKNHFGT